ncbi:MAG: YfiR family protein [Desulfobulbus sp.]|jgi:hypothetical protein
MRTSRRHNLRIRHIIAVLLALYCLDLGTAHRACGSDGEVEYKVKAAFLYNFSRFITWPKTVWPNPQTPFAICVAGTDPFGPYLLAVEEKKIGNRPVKVKTGVNPRDLGGQCQLVFVSAADAEQAHGLIKNLEGTPVVTVSDMKGFAGAGGIFEFTTRGGRLAFIINNTKARKQGVQISASLLSLATEVL